MTGADDPTEIELTLRLDPKSVSRLMRDPLLRKLKQGPKRTRKLISTYFDTADFRLQRGRAALRVRQIGDQRIQTVKLASNAQGGVLARREWERAVDGNAPDLRDIDDRHLRKLLDSDVKDRLAPIFVSEITRSTWPLRLDGSAIELAVDVGEIKTDRGSVPVCEAELELKHGNVESVYRLAQELTKRVPLVIEPRSKAERGYALARNTKPGPHRAANIHLDKGMTAAAAFQVIARNCLLHLRANDASVRTAAAADSVHQLRVAIRRLRSALVAFDPIMAPEERRRIGQSVKWIAQRCGRARELDVFQDDVVKPLRERLPEDAALGALGKVVETARREAYAAVDATLDSKEYTDTLLALESWIEGERWRVAGAGDGDVPVRDFARGVLKHLHRKLVKDVDSIDALDEAALHALRIRAKKLRYAAEFFRSVFRGKAAKSYIAALTAIQDSLGSLNDGATARDLVADLGQRSRSPDKAAFDHAAGVVLGWNACRIAADLKRLPKVWAAFTETKPFWK